MSSKPAKEVQYVSPFPFTGSKKEHDGYIYTLINDADFESFRKMADEMEGYALHYDDDNILVWDRKLKGQPLNLIKVFGTFDCSAEVLWDVLQDPEYRIDWDEARLEAYELTKLNEFQDIGYYAGKSPSKGISDRDFVNQRAWRKCGNGEYLIFNSSVKATACPEKKGRVRAISKLSGYFIQRCGSGCCLTYLTMADPCGWIPKFVVNFLTTKFVPGVMRKLRKATAGYLEWCKKHPNINKLKDSWKCPEKPWPTAKPTATKDFAAKRWASGSKTPIVPLDENEDEKKP